MSTKAQLDGLPFDNSDCELTRFFPHEEAVQSGAADACRRLTTDELLAEVLRRTAGDTTELRLHSQAIIRAQLAETDREATSEVIGTTEMEFSH
jgi:hypothetical protein